MLIIVWFIVGTIFAFICAGMARRRGRHAGLWAFLGFCFGLLTVLVLAAVGSERNASNASVYVSGADNRYPVGAPTIGGNAEADAKWATLVKYDDDIRGAVASLKHLGDGAVEKLRFEYMILNDKSKLPLIVKDIMETTERHNETQLEAQILGSNIFKFTEGVIFGLREPARFIVFSEDLQSVRDTSPLVFNSVGKMELEIPQTRDRVLLFGADRTEVLANYSENAHRVLRTL